MGRVPRPTGRQLTLRAGAHRATITQVGAAVRRYQVAGRDVIVPFGADEESPAAHGAVLWPWPNRVGDGRYEFGGRTYQLALTEPERATAIHGLVRHTRWRIEHHDDRRVRLELDLVPQPGYPFPLRARIDYRLDPVTGLRVRLRTMNLGDAPAPYGAGFHPWLSPGPHRLDECAVRIDATRWVRSDERLLPVAEEPIPDRLDFRVDRPLGDTALDDAFVGLPDGRAWVRLTQPDGGWAGCWLEPPLRCWQVCTGDNLPAPGARGGLAAEPMTCTADALRTGRRLVVLAPGERHEVRWGLVGQPPP